MAFNTNDYIQGGFDLSGLSTMEDYKEAAIAIAQTDAAPPAVKNWAKQALWLLNGAGSNNFQGWDSLDEVIDENRSGSVVTLRSDLDRWLSGEAQPTQARRAKTAYNENISEATDKLNNELANLANQFDFSGLTQEQIEIEMRNTGGYTDRIASIQNQINALNEYGIDTDEYAQQITAANERLGIAPKDLAGTQFTPTGTTYDAETGSFFSTADGAQVDADQARSAAAQAERDAVNASYEEGIYQSTILPDTVNTNGLTEGEVKDLEQAYLAAGNDVSLQDKIFNQAEITNEDISSFLQTAKDEYSEYYGQAFGRATEDFQKELDFQAENRQRELAMEKLNAFQKRKNARASLEASGMAQSGAAKELLGEDSAFKTDMKGLLQQEEDILTSSSEATFKKGIEDFGRRTEEFLGAEALGGVQVPKIGGEAIFTPTEGVRGSLEREQTTAEQTRASDLEGLARTRRTEIIAAEGGVSTF